MEKPFRTDRYGAVVVYPDDARDVIAIARNEAKKMTGMQDVIIKDLSFNKPLNIWVAIFPYNKKNVNKETLWDKMVKIAEKKKTK